ncbi:ABC transporter ATP-binding protein [Rhodococcus erythropolis]|uniref:ABC transporter ATP-binding protein n=1 Tax=Rhodococcus erythropolis TaxID=1833 RepID=UPI000AC7EBFC|nr:ABC transporter ATP-binding protein [Rhodococcus erythropolis]GCB57230.1 macrolide ABC transporter ATP-binding protein [Rhodococcus erythropolis]
MNALIAITDLGFVYPGPPPVEALISVNLTVATGEYVALVGPSGSGKSTMLNVLGLLDRHTSGDYLLAGSDVLSMRDAERTELRSHSIGFVFQAFHLMPHRTAWENVSLALMYRKGISPSVRRERAVAALERVGLRDKVNAYPTQLSGGQRQRVAIARACVGDPALLLCDEPTGNLDSETATRVLEMIEELHAQGQTVVVITHDEAVAARAHRRIRVRDGRTEEID